MLVPAKSVVESKTAWFAVAVAVLAVLEAVVGLFTVIGISTEWVLGGLAALIYILRAVTNQPVSLTAGKLKEIKDS